MSEPEKKSLDSFGIETLESNETVKKNYDHVNSDEEIDQVQPSWRLRVFNALRYLKKMRKRVIAAAVAAILVLIYLGFSFIPHQFNGRLVTEQYYFQVYCPWN